MTAPLELIPPLHKATHQVGLYIGRHEAARDTSQAEAHVLAHLAPLGTCSLADLHESFGHKRSTLTSILNRLEERGLIERAINPEDRRSFVIVLTRRGRSTANGVHRALRALEQAVAARVKPSELRGFVAVVAAMAVAAEE